MPTLFPHLSVADNLTMRRRFLEANVAEILSLFRLDHLKDKRPASLSGGEAQRVNIARAATWAADLEGGVLLLDEPFTGMDVVLRDEILHDMQVWLAKRNICVLSVTHDVAEAFQLGAEVIKIAEGKVIAQGPVEVVLADERERLLKQLQS
jgi:molybdate transport system ATP-binding protein